MEILVWITSVCFVATDPSTTPFLDNSICTLIIPILSDINLRLSHYIAVQNKDCIESFI